MRSLFRPGHHNTFGNLVTRILVVPTLHWLKFLMSMIKTDDMVLSLKGVLLSSFAELFLRLLPEA